MDTISQARLGEVHPVLSARITQLDHLLAASALAVHIRITQGLRTWNEQDALYAQGRTMPGKIVTQARGGFSAHNFGYAVDFAPDDPEFPVWHPDWTVGDARWKTVLAMALDCGLAEGAQWRTFPDTPHLYLPELPATPDENMRYLYREGGMEAVWKDWDEKF